MPQFNYNLEPPQAVPGMRFSPATSDVVTSRPALVACPFGVLLELVVVNGVEYVQPVQDTSGGWSAALIYGVSVFDPAREQGLPPSGVVEGVGGVPGTAGYNPNEFVPVLRSGAIYVQTDGQAAWGATTWPPLGQVNVWHSSDGTHPQGVFTMAATSATSGAEIDAVPTSIIGTNSGRVQTYTNFVGAVFNTAVVTINYPGTT